MVTKFASCLTLTIAALIVFEASTASAQLIPFDRDAIKIQDYVSLRLTGEKLVGEITVQSRNERGTLEHVIIKTEDGTTLKLDGRFVSKAHEVDADDKLYNNKVDIINDDPEGHWSCVHWLKKQKGGAARYKDQIQFHLKRIMELDPNDDKVKTRLKYKYIESQNRWVPEDLYYKNLGYVRKGTGWAPALQQSINEAADAQKELLGDRKRRFANWKKAVRTRNSRNISKVVLQKELFEFCDAPAVELIFKEAQKETDEFVRGLYVEAFGRVPTGAAAQALVYFSVQSRAHGDRALDLLKQPHFNQEYAASHMARYFDPKKYFNGTLQRAAFCIGELNAKGAILPLIGVLKTTHQVKPADDPGRLNLGFSNSGTSFQPGGNSQPQTVQFSNRKVVAALGKITEQDFGFDEAAWKKWYVYNYSIVDVNVRGDDDE